MGALKHPSPGVRRAALMVLPRVNETTQAILSGNLLADADAQVRMAALLALAELPENNDASPAVVAMLGREENSNDRWIPHAAAAAAARHVTSFLKAVLTASTPSDSLTRTIRIVTGHYSQGGPVESVVSTILALKGASETVATAVIDGLAANWPRGATPTVSPDEEAKLKNIMDSLPNDARSSLVSLAGRWGKKPLFSRRAGRHHPNIAGADNKHRFGFGRTRRRRGTTSGHG